MNRQIINAAQIVFLRLQKKYTGFYNVILDDWRGYRFIYDTDDVRRCRNDCRNCKLYLLLKNETARNGFAPGLRRANQEDKRLFGPQNYLNCKTLAQYRTCYVNFINKRVRTISQLRQERQLIRKLRIIYSRNANRNIQERAFKRSILDKTTKPSSNKYA